MANAADVSDQLVADLIADYPRSIGDKLRREVNRLRAELFADDVIAAALRKWRDRPDAKPGLLPYLVGDVVKERMKPATSQRSKIAGWLDTAEATPSAIPIAAPSTARQCPWCRDTGLVLMSDGTPGSDPSACNHENGSRRPATSDDIAEYERRRRLA